MLAFLGTMNFPMRFGYIDTNILLIVMDIFMEPQRLTLLHMILAKIFCSLSTCARGHDFFGCYNLLLQIWVIKHFYRRPWQMDYTVDAPSKIQSHKNYLRYCIAPIGEEKCRMLLTNLTRYSIQWKYFWMAGLAFIRNRHSYFIELIGLGDIQSYAPLPVLGQFGVI